MSNYFSKKSNRYFLWALILVIPFLIIAALGHLYPESVTSWDYQMAEWIYEMREAELTQYIERLTRIGDGISQVIVTAVIGLIFANLVTWKLGLWYILTVLFGAEFLNNAVKNIHQRIRPTEVTSLIEQGGYAFPSGHSMGTMILYGGLIYMIWRHGHSQSIKFLTTILVVLVIIGVGFSRIYLGVHYLTDVIGGWSLGLAWLMLCIGIYDRLIKS